MSTDPKPPTAFPWRACGCSARLLEACGQCCTTNRRAPALDMVCPYIPRPVLTAIHRLRTTIPGSTDPDETDVELQHEFFLSSPALQAEHDLDPVTLPAYLWGAVRYWLVERARRRRGRTPRGEAGFCAHSHKSAVGTVFCTKFGVTLDRVAPCKAHGHDGSGACPHFRYTPPATFVSAPPDDPTWLDRQGSSSDKDPEEALAHAERLAQLEADLGSLDDQERLVVIFTYGLDGEEPQSSKAISERLGLPLGRVQSLRHRALTKLVRR